MSHNNLRCPNCNRHGLTRVVDSRPHEVDGEPAIKRRRVCDHCDTRVTTIEVTSAQAESAYKSIVRTMIQKLMDELTTPRK